MNTTKTFHSHRTRALSVVATLVLGMALISCSAGDPDATSSTIADTISFEKEYVRSLPYENSRGIKLIGFKTITVPDDEIEQFDAVYNQYKGSLENYLWDHTTGILRVYFPVESALVEHEDSIAEASHLGELDFDASEDEAKQLHVLGRRQTDTVTGVEGNIIEDGIIYLAEKKAADHQFDQVLVFDFGVKMFMDDHNADNAAHKSLAAGTSCMNNHGGVNCSQAYGIYMGRCTFNKSVCMDYNGWATTCVNGKWYNFPGSDCDYALGAGHCWNEVM